MLKHVFLARFEPVVARFGPWKIPKCLENGPFWDQQWVKNGSKTRFSKDDLGPFMMLKQVILDHFEPVATGFGSWKIPKCLENGPFWDQKWVKNGLRTRFSKCDPRPFEMLKQVFLARFQPVLTEFSPFRHMYAPRCALRTYLGALPNLRHFGQKQPFFVQNSPQTRAKRPNEGKHWPHPTCGLTSPCQGALHCPSTPQCVRPTAQTGPKSAQCAPTPRNQARAVSWATWLKSEFRGHLVHPQAPTFCGFQASKSPDETPRPHYQWSLGEARGQPSSRTVRANGGSTMVPRSKKFIFSNVASRPLGMLKQVFLARF